MLEWLRRLFGEHDLERLDEARVSDLLRPQKSSAILSYSPVKKSP